MRMLMAATLALVAAVAYTEGATPAAGVPEMKNLEHGTMSFWHDVKFTPDTTDPSGKRGTWAGWFHQDVVDASKLKDGVIRGKIDGQWLDLKVVSLPDDFCKWNFGKRIEQLAVIKKMMSMPEGAMGGMMKPEISG